MNSNEVLILIWREAQNGCNSLKLFIKNKLATITMENAHEGGGKNRLTFKCRSKSMIVAITKLCVISSHLKLGGLIINPLSGALVVI